MNKFLLSIVAITGVMLGDSLISQATGSNLVRNPSFERGPDKKGPDDLCPNNGKLFVCVKPGTNAIPHWEVFDIDTNAGIPLDYIPRKFWKPAPGAGDWSLDLSGSHKGGIQQTITTEVGQLYQLDFLMAGNPKGGPNPKEILFSSIDGVTTSFTFDATGNSFTQMRWQRQRLIFEATDTETTIAFFSNTSGVYGPAFDRVEVTKSRGRLSDNNKPRSLTIARSQRASASVPENSSGFGILAFGFFGAGLMIKNKMGRSGTNI